MTLTADRRADARYDPLLTEKLIAAIGPQHPSLTAPVQLRVQTDGELIEHVQVECGFMHRGVEQLAACRPWAQLAPLLSRCEWLAGANGDYLASAAIEQLCGLAVPPRAQLLRCAVLELSRLSSHLFWFGDLGLELGAITPIFWALREREAVLDLLELLSGHRWHGQYIVPGGVAAEPPPQWFDGLRALCASLPGKLNAYEDLFSDNAIWVNRSEFVGVLEPDFAQKHGASGPVLRASGVDCDLRRDAPYAAYGELKFAVPVGEYGDTLDRYRVRFLEMRESLRLLEQCAEKLGGRPSLAADLSLAADSSLAIDSIDSPESPAGTRALQANIPKGEAYVAVEGPRGELGLYVSSGGGPSPLRAHLRSPSLYHLHLMDELCRGHLLADVFAIYASLDIMIGEVDR